MEEHICSHCWLKCKITAHHASKDCKFGGQKLITTKKDSWLPSNTEEEQSKFNYNSDKDSSNASFIDDQILFHISRLSACLFRTNVYHFSQIIYLKFIKL